MTTAKELRNRAIENPDQEYRCGTRRHAFAGNMVECIVTTNWETNNVKSTVFYIGTDRVSYAKVDQYLADNNI